VLGAACRSPQCREGCRPTLLSVRAPKRGQELCEALEFHLQQCTPQVGARRKPTTFHDIHVLNPRCWCHRHHFTTVFHDPRRSFITYSFFIFHFSRVSLLLDRTNHWLVKDSMPLPYLFRSRISRTGAKVLRTFASSVLLVRHIALSTYCYVRTTLTV